MLRMEKQDVVRHPLDDGEIVRRVVEGDTALFEVLMRRHNQRLYRAALAILGNPDEAEDVVQQAYINAYTHLRQFEGKASFSTWLTRIAVHEAYGRLRKRRPEEPIDDRHEPQSHETIPSIDPERGAINRELRDALEAEITALPEHYRTVFMMREVEGLSTARTAELLEISRDVVKTRLKRARERLRGGLYRRAGVRGNDLFAFLGERCDRIVAAVFRLIS